MSEYKSLIVIGCENVINRNTMGGIFCLAQQNKEMRRSYMLVTILKTLFKFVLKLGLTFGLAFMVACTVFVIVCVIRGDIKINIIKGEIENEKK